MAGGVGTDEEIAGVAVIAVSPYEVELGAIDAADAQVEQPQIIGFVDRAEFLLDLEEETQGSGLVALAQPALPPVVEGFADAADLVRMLAVVLPGDPQDRVVVVGCSGAFCGFGLEQGVTGPELPASEGVGRKFPEEPQNAVGRLCDDFLGMGESFGESYSSSGTAGEQEEQGSVYERSHHRVGVYVGIEGNESPRSVQIRRADLSRSAPFSSPF